MVLKVHLWLTLGNTTLHVHCSGLPADRAFKLIVSLKDGLEKAICQLNCRRLCSACSLLKSPWRQSVSNQYNSFTWKMVLEKAFVGEIGEDSVLHINYSGLLEDRTLTWKIVLKWWFIGYTREDSALHIHCAGLLGDRAVKSQCNSFTWNMVLKRPFISHSWEDSTLHIHCLGLLGESTFSLL